MNNSKKILISISLFFFIITGIGFSNIKPAKAQWATFGVVDSAKWIWEKIGDALNFAALRTVYKLTDYTAEYVAQQAAFGVLNQVLEGETGGKPLFETKTASELFADAASSAAGDFIGDLSSSLNDSGFEKLNLCSPSLDIKLSLTLGLLDVEKPPAPNCDFNNVVNNWKEFGETLKDKKLASILQVNFTKKKLDVSAYDTPQEQEDAYNEYFSKMFSVKKNELGTFLSLQDEIKKDKNKTLEEKKAEFAKCQGFKDKKTPITEKKQTGCETIAKELESSGDITSEQAKNFSGGDFRSLSWEGVPLALTNAISNASMSFLMTIAGQLSRFYIEKGLLGMHQYEDDDNFEDLVSRLRGGFDFSRPPRGYDISKEIKTPDFQEMPEYSLLTNYVVCPGEEDIRKADHCVIDNEFLSLITKKKTIRQLIDEGSLDDNLPLISPENPTHQSYDCYKNGLCYKNLVKLRKAGVLPIGWELAALASPGSNPVVLAEVLGCFEDSDNSNANYNCIFGDDDTGHNPFYHLIDEDWVLKEPSAMCQSLAYSNELQSSLSSRRVQYCADFKTCLEEDEQGNCKTNYGYCTRSENIWRFEGDSCNPNYAGCLSFESASYGRESYIQDTLEYCTSNNAGCLRYSQEKDSNGDWVLDSNISIGSNDLFLNSNTSSCPDNYEGCSEYIVMTPAIGSGSGPNLIANSSFDGETNNTPTGWSGAGSIFDGKVIIGTTPLYTNITLLPNTNYNIAILAAQTGSNSDAIIDIATCDGSNDCSSSSIAGGEEGIGNCSLSNNNIKLEFNPSNTSLEKGYCNFKTNEYVASASINIYSSTGLLDFDNIQLKIVSSANSFAPSYSSYGDGGKINLNKDRVMCQATEVGCQGYTPSNGGYLIPAIITQDDLCPAECLNYDSFAQMPSSFDELESNYEVEYYNFIPETGIACPAQYIGCESFTNLGSQSQGGEYTEHYSFLRQCVYEESGETYYTWEGSDVAGYQIETWLALKSNIDQAPCTNISPGGDTCQDTTDTVASCGADTADIYDDPEYNPHCREFFDIAGNTHWRLQNRLIFATDNCLDYRRNSSGQLYKGIASLSNSCSIEHNNCRAYKGNSANNLRSVFKDDFEDGTYNSWNTNNGSLDISNASLSNNGKSLKLSTNSTFTRAIADTIQLNKNFEISWWMMNTGIIDNISLQLLDDTGAEIIDLGELPLDSDEDIAISNWQDYKLTITNDSFAELDYASLADNMSLQLIVNGADFIYIDNLELRETIGNISLIKDSWTTPASCDLPYTGYYLGCQEHIDGNGQAYNLKSFNELCSEEAIGCTGVINTHNSDSPFAETYGSGNAELTISADSIEYLVPDIDKYCPGEYQGCQALGLPELDTTDTIVDYDTVFRINDPDQYSDNLCEEDGLYCDNFVNSKGQMYYFKYPGDKLCRYETDITYNNALTDGWWKIDTLNTDTPEPCDYNNNWVNICPEEQNLCTEFRDPNDMDDCTAGNCDITVEGDYQSYYYFDNEEIDKTSCTGQVDQNSGCMLFYNANNWNSSHSEVIAIYDSIDTYASSTAAGTPMTPSTCDPTIVGDCDSNELIKVKKDRKCSEWLACKSLTQVTDNKGQVKNICDSVGICTEYNYDSSDPFRSCAQWANYTNLDDDIITKVDPLTKEEYQGRLAGTYLGWSDDEYLGYSVPDMYPVEGLVVYNFTDGPRLVINGGTHAACVDVANNGDDCNVGDFYGECSEERCWLNPQAGNSDDIYYGLSTRGYTIEESPFPDTVINPTTSEISSNHQQVEICNSDNPSGCETTYQKVSYGLNYSKYIAKGESSSDMVCTEGDPDLLGEDCSTSTDKDVYCQGEMGFGTCSKKTKVETYYNWPGICVEYDKSPKGSNILVDTDAGGSYDRIPNLCTQWYPVESISGTDSLYDNYDEAGYYNADGDLYFCSVGEAYTIPEDLIYCGYFNDNYCNLLMVAPAGSKINIAEFENSYLKHLMKDTIGDIKYQTDTVSSKEVIYPTTGSGRLIPGDASDSRFMREDFNLESGTGDISLESDIEALFDGTLKYYYYDENVKPNATYSGSSYLSVGLTNNNKIICSHNDESEESGFPACDDNKHKVYTKHVYLENGIGGDGTYPGYTPDHKDCPWDEGVYGHKSYCNELNHNYYVYNPEDGVEECNELDCSGPTYGRECMRSKTIYKGYYDSINAGTEDDGTDEYDIVSLIEALTISNDYCSEYDLSGLPESFPDLDISSEIEDCLAATTETDCSTPGSGYTISLSGNTCAGDACYQQCGQVVEVDSIAEHNKTIVRADIWWRSKNNPTSDIVNWSAYAYSSASYGSSALKYSEIGSATILDGNFGAAQDWDNTLPIITEVPVGTVLNNTYYSSSVFFGTEYIVTELKKLFYQVYNLEWSGNSYDHLSTDGLGDIVNSYAGAVYDPKAYKLDCSGGNLCTFGDEGITVEYDQSGNAAIKFYYYAYPDASPIKAIKVDWEGLGYFTGTIGKYKNRIPKCNSDWTMPHSLECTDADDNGICDNPTDTGVDMQGFGGTNDACSEGYKVFQYNYTYSGDPAVECDGTDGKSNKEGTSCYKPQIKIVDWWDQEEIYTSDTWIEVD